MQKKKKKKKSICKKPVALRGVELLALGSIPSTRKKE
jgi:hypothetical protein